MSATPDDDVVAIDFAFAELPRIVGREFKSAWLSVDHDKLELFDVATYTSSNPLPLDSTVYPEGLVEGFHLLGLLDHLSNPLFRLTDGALAGWNYGLDTVRFVSPVRAGEPLRLTGRVSAVEAKGDAFKVRLDCRLDVAGRERPALVAAWWVLWLRAEQPEPESPQSAKHKSTLTTTGTVIRTEGSR